MSESSTQKILYLDPFSGIAGDMFIAALLDMGLDLARLHHELSKLKISGYRLSSKKVMRGAMSATKFDVEIDAAVQTYRTFSGIKSLIEESTLSERVKSSSLKCFTVLGMAEGRIHNMPLETVHFHEVGAIDSIVDLVGACIALELLGIDEVQCGPVALGSGGFVKCDHGMMPVPAPATLEIMKDIPLRQTPIEKELTTPTGAALAAGLVSKFGPMPSMTVSKIGYGAGTREQQAVPNVLRIAMGTIISPSIAQENESSDSIIEIQTNIDDASPEVLGFLCEQLLCAGALDVFVTSVQMKKSRPGVLLTVLAAPRLLDSLAAMLFTESSTFGLRYQTQSRLKLTRRIETVQTPFGAIRVKIGEWQGKRVSIHPEYEDCRALAIEKKVALREISDAAKVAAQMI